MTFPALLQPSSEGLRLSQNRFAGFCSPQNKFCGGPILFDRLWSPELRAPAPYTPHSRRGPEGPLAQFGSGLRAGFADFLRKSAGYGVFSRHMSVKKHSIGKALRERGPFNGLQPSSEGRFCFGA